MGIKIGRGRAMVELDDDLSNAIEDTIDRLIPGLRVRMQRAMDELVAPVQAAWPVKTGLSKRSFEWGVRLPDINTLEGYAVNNAGKRAGKEYAYIITGPDGKQLWRELLVKPSKDLEQRLGDELAAEAQRIVDGGE